MRRVRTGRLCKTLTAVPMVVALSTLALLGCGTDSEAGVATKVVVPVSVCGEPPLIDMAVRTTALLKPTMQQLDPTDSDLFMTASDIAVSRGTLYLVDTRLNSAALVDGAGRGRTFANRGQGPGELLSPRAIEIGPDGDVYVGDEQGRVSVYSPDGTFQRTIPVRSAVWDLLVLPNGHLVIATRVTATRRPTPYVTIVDEEGRVVREVLSSERMVARERPLMGALFNFPALAQGPHGRFVVWYPYDNYLEVFDVNGEALGRIPGCVREGTADYFSSMRTTPPGTTHGIPLTPPAGPETIGVGFVGPDTLVVAHGVVIGRASALVLQRYSLQGVLADVLAFPLHQIPEGRVRGAARNPLEFLSKVLFPSPPRDLANIELVVSSAFPEGGVFHLSIQSRGTDPGVVPADRWE